MKIDIWGDIVCPFCIIGKRHLDLALENFEHRDGVELVWHSFELDPAMPREPEGTLVEQLAKKFGITTAQSEQGQRDVAARAAQSGLEFNWREAKYGSTFDAHRLVHLAAAHGRSEEAVGRLMQAYFTDGAAISDPAVLERIGVAIGLPEQDVRDMLHSTAHADAVRADEAKARDLGITSVPFFVLDDTFALSGAQPVEVFGQALAQAWDAR